MISLVSNAKAVTKINAALALADSLALTDTRVPSGVLLNTGVVLALDVAARAKAISKIINICNVKDKTDAEAANVIAAKAKVAAYAALSANYIVNDNIYAMFDAYINAAADAYIHTPTDLKILF